MTHDNDKDRDEVLIAFHDECEFPTRADVERWTRRFPRYAADIRDHASIRLAILAEAQEGFDEIDENELARGRSRVGDALYRARNRISDAKDSDFMALLEKASITPMELARKLPIRRVIVADLIAGRMAKPRQRFVAAVCNALGVTREAFDGALALATRVPSVGLAKADGQPKAIQRDYDDIIRTSEMTRDEIRFWLEQD